MEEYRRKMAEKYNQSSGNKKAKKSKKSLERLNKIT